MNGPNSVLNCKSPQEFTFKRSPGFPYYGFKIIAGCAYKLGLVSRRSRVLSIFLKFPCSVPFLVGCCASVSCHRRDVLGKMLGREVSMLKLDVVYPIVGSQVLVQCSVSSPGDERG